MKTNTLIIFAAILVVCAGAFFYLSRARQAASTIKLMNYDFTL